MRALLPIHCLLLSVAACGDRDTGKSNAAPVALTVQDTVFTLRTWNRDVRFNRGSLAFGSRLDGVNALVAMPPRLVSGRVLHSAALEDTIYVLATIASESSADFGAHCSPSYRETVLAWFRIPRVGNPDPPRTVRYESCWEQVASAGVNDAAADSIWVDLTSAVRKRRAHVAYDPARPALGLRYTEVATSPVPDNVVTTIRAGDSVVSTSNDGDGPEPYEPAELRDPAEVTALPAHIRDTLKARGCQVVQETGKRETNVVRGAFFGPDVHGWAVWCAINDTSRLVIFQDGQTAPADVLWPFLAARPDTTHRPPGYPYCTGAIGRTPARELEKHLRAGRLGDPRDSALSPEERNAPVHDGISDSDCELQVFRYWTGKRWVSLVADGH